MLDGDVHNSTRTEHFAKKFPDRFFNVGIERSRIAVSTTQFEVGATVRVARVRVGAGDFVGGARWASTGLSAKARMLTSSFAPWQRLPFRDPTRPM